MKGSNSPPPIPLSAAQFVPSPWQFRGFVTAISRPMIKPRALSAIMPKTAAEELRRRFQAGIIEAALGIGERQALGDEKAAEIDPQGIGANRAGLATPLPLRHAARHAAPRA